MPDAPLSLRAYARHRGCSHQAVIRAIAGHRLVRSLVWVNGSAKIADVVLADAEWAARTDASKVPNGERARLAGGPAGSAMDEEGGAPVLSLAVSTALQKHWQAKQAELDFREAAKQLVDSVTVLERIVDVHVRCRTKLLGVPSRAKQALPHLSPADVLVLDTLVREALEDLAVLPVKDRTVA